mmetsp:Transcript_5299/g.8708  ORF Transcript_5299/g.8708 Transcript_5299/m.8708 type:complete len:323 (+) Transcript_5299:167-1135(+)|eukprot:CAMPEP_0119005544 /NCGR_PEP_ID=MMETSP1176-20130426/1786_1 /TAXON_ID=265551 /ORGANISM="Synedropsis recta cf, Strain CCMP1620" /LENGTH=322 /DNA_ID=CAMNT_0006957371 /DNA_START=164 /DNA_END=1132 /DNA_ORIENTATION=+
MRWHPLFLLSVLILATAGVVVDALFQFKVPPRILNSRFVSSFPVPGFVVKKISKTSTQPKFVWEQTRRARRRHRQQMPDAFDSIQTSWRRRKNLLGLFRPNRPLDRVSQQLFDDADVNGDGWITVTEAYEFVLQMYIVMNRHAPLSPPSRSKVEQLFYEYDNNRHDRGLNKDEFMQLLQHFTQRAASTMVAHQWVTLVGAPLLTEGVLRFVRPVFQKCDPLKLLVQTALPSRLMPIVTSITFLRSILLLFFATTLADIVLATVNWILDLTTPAATPPDIATMLNPGGGDKDETKPDQNEAQQEKSNHERQEGKMIKNPGKKE